jgi:hypothetical protein
MDYNQGKETLAHLKFLYIIISILVLLNIGQFVYFYKMVIDLKSEIKIIQASKPKEKIED